MTCLINFYTEYRFINEPEGNPYIMPNFCPPGNSTTNVHLSPTTMGPDSSVPCMVIRFTKPPVVTSIMLKWLALACTTV